MPLTMPQHIYRHRRAKRFRPGGVESEVGGQKPEVSWEQRAEVVIQAVAAVLMDARLFLSVTRDDRPKRVVFTVCERMDSDVMHRARMRLVNAGTLEPIFAHCRLPLVSPTFAAYRSVQHNVRVEFQTME